VLYNVAYNVITPVMLAFKTTKLTCNQFQFKRVDDRALKHCIRLEVKNKRLIKENVEECESG
jgi:hypothetical protein